MILPLGIFIALVWFLAWLLTEGSDDPGFVAIFGAGAIIAATIAIHRTWPVTAALAEAVK